MLQERNERGCHGEQLAGRDVHVVDVSHGNLRGRAKGAVKVAGTGDHTLGGNDVAALVEVNQLTRLGVDRRVGGSDVVLLLLVGGHPVDVIGDVAVNDATIRGLDEAVVVHAGAQGQRADQANVGTLGGLDGAHARVVRVVDVTNGGGHVGAPGGAALVTSKAARAERGQTALVGEARQRVGLVHELRQLRGAKELLDGRDDGTVVDERLGRDVVRVLRGHVLADDALHAAHADAELVLDKLAHGADATVAKVVDVVGLLAGVTRGQGQQVAQGLNDVLVGQDTHVRVDVGAELLVDLKAADLGKVIALGVKEQAVQEGAGGVNGGRLAGALATVDLQQRVLAGGGAVTLDGGADDVGVTKQRENLVIGLGDAKGAQDQRRGHAALAVDGDDQLAALVDLKLQPCATRGDELDVEGLHAVVQRGGEVHARRADELRHDDALGAVHDEGAALGHEREVAHEDELVLHLAGLLVNKGGLDDEGRLVGDVSGAALGDGVGRLTKLVVAKGHLHGARGVLDGRCLGKGLGKTVGEEVLVGVLLHRDQVGRFDRHGDLAKADALRGVKRLCGSHQAFPPS